MSRVLVPSRLLAAVLAAVTAGLLTVLIIPGNSEDPIEPPTTLPTADPAGTDPATTMTAEPPVDPSIVPVGSSDPSNSDRWKLVFNDEFNNDSIDDNKWTACYWWDAGGCTNLGNNELEWYLPEQRSVSEGSLRLTAEAVPVEASDGQTYPYRSGMVTTGRSGHRMGEEPRFAFTYGLVEAEMRLPSGKGLWPALWLLPVTHEERPEIDILEVIGDRPNTYEFHMHTYDQDGEPVSPGGRYEADDLDGEWHVVAVEWRPDAVIWFVDGEERWRVEENIPDEPMYVLANLAVGGDWPGSPDETTVFPAEFEIDYVRVWQE